jgi:hypothetical protein
MDSPLEQIFGLRARMDAYAPRRNSHDPAFPPHYLGGTALDVVTKDGTLHCACDSRSNRCPSANKVHVVDVAWERDPAEKDRRQVRMTLMCKEGHVSLFFIRNHGGISYFDCVIMDDECAAADARKAAHE